MYKWYYFLVLALKGYKLLAIRKNVIFSYNIDNDSYDFWYYQKPYKSLVHYNSCKDVSTAKFLWNVLIKGALN